MAFCNLRFELKFVIRVMILVRDNRRSHAGDDALADANTTVYHAQPPQPERVGEFR